MLKRLLNSQWGSELVTAGVAAITFLIPLVISRSLLFGNSDLRTFAINASRTAETGVWFIGAHGDFTRSLGISNYPIALFLDLPWLISTSVSEHLAQPVFGLLTCMSLYLAVNLLGSVAGIPAPLRRIGGFLLPLLMFLPGPVEWNSFPRYAGSFGWVVAAATVTLMTLFGAMKSKARLNLVLIFLSGCVLFWANIHYLPMTLPVAILAFGFSWYELRASVSPSRIVQCAVSFFVPAMLVLPIFAGVYLYGVWAIPDIAVQENIDSFRTWRDLVDVVLIFPALGDIPLIGAATNGIAVRLLVTMALSGVVWWNHQRHPSRLSRLGALSLVALSVYAIIYYLTARFVHRELGLDPKYIEIFAYPVWILLILHFLLSRRFARSAVLQGLGIAFPIVLMIAWVGQWTIRNHEVRLQPAEYPVLLSPTSRALSDLTTADRETGLLSRTIIIQERFSDERGGRESRIRRATGFTETFYLELSQLKIPVLNAYSHMISPRTFSLTNDLFGDGRPSWRQYSLYDRANVAAMPALGIKYVLSEVKLEESGLELISSDSYRTFGLFPAAGPVYLYKVTLPAETSNPIVRYSITRTGIRLEGTAPRPTAITVPVEYSRCLTLRGPTATSATIEKGPGILVTIRASGTFNIELRYENSLFQLRNCRILDYIDFRRDQRR